MWNNEWWYFHFCRLFCSYLIHTERVSKVKAITMPYQTIRLPTFTKSKFIFNRYRIAYESEFQSSAQTFMHNAILLIDTFGKYWYNQIHWLIGTPYLSTIASNEPSLITGFWGNSMEFTLTEESVTFDFVFAQSEQSFTQQSKTALFPKL